MFSWSASLFKSLASDHIPPKVQLYSLFHLLHVLCVHCSYCMYCLCYDLYTSSEKYPKEVLKSLENIKNSKNLRDFTLWLKQLPSHSLASIVCGCLQSRTLETLVIVVEEVRVYYKLCRVLHFLVYCTVV